MNPHRLEGRRFGRLTVLERTGSIRARSAWRCRCDCGREVVVAADSLCNERTRSCGCIRVELTRERARARREARP